MKLEGNKANEYQIPEIGFFEGTEKLLEIWFHHENQGNHNHHTVKHERKNDLREIPR